MSTLASPPRRKGFVRDTVAASAVEFALVAPILFALVFTTFEMGWYMVQSVLLDHGLDSATRMVRIGHTGAIDHAEFKTLVCEQSIYLLECENDLAVEMIPVSSMADLPASDAVCADRASPIAPLVRFNPGARSETLYLRACLLVEPLVPGMGLGRHMNVDANGTTRIISASAFVNEPD